MAIDTMGSPQIKRIVTDSSNRVANARKKAEKSSVGIMVLSTADQALKAKAAKRAEEFWNSDNAELAQAEDYFNASTEFQIAHKAKYGDMTRSQWEQAKRIEHKKQWATDNISELDPLIAQELNAQANLDLENDLEIYNKRYNLSSDMKLSGSMTLPKLEKRYYESYNTNKEKEIKNRINKAGVLNSTLNFFGIGREDDAESIEMKAMQAWKDNATAEKVRWDETTEEYKVATGDNKLEQMYHTKKPNIDVTAVYGSFNKELGSLINNDGTKDYIKGNTSLQIKYGDGEDRETISAFEFSNQLNREDRIAFWKNVKVIASADYYKYKKSFGASSEGVLETTDFLQGAIDKIQQANNGTPRLQGIDSKRTALDTFGDWFTGRSASYDAMTPNELRAITIGELDSKYTSSFNRQQTQNYNNVLSSTALNNAADNIDIMSGQGVEVDTVHSIYNFLSAKNNDTNEYTNNFTKNEIADINEALNNSPDSNAKAQVRLLFNQRIAEMPEETSKELVSEIQETITATDESSNISKLDTVLKGFSFDGLPELPSLPIDKKELTNEDNLFIYGYMDNKYKNVTDIRSVTRKDKKILTTKFNKKIDAVINNIVKERKSLDKSTLSEIGDYLYTYVGQYTAKAKNAIRDDISDNEADKLNQQIDNKADSLKNDIDERSRLNPFGILNDQYFTEQNVNVNNSTQLATYFKNNPKEFIRLENNNGNLFEYTAEVVVQKEYDTYEYSAELTAAPETFRKIRKENFDPEFIEKRIPKFEKDVKEWVAKNILNISLEEYEKNADLSGINFTNILFGSGLPDFIMDGVFGLPSIPGSNIGKPFLESFGKQKQVELNKSFEKMREKNKYDGGFYSPMGRIFKNVYERDEKYKGGTVSLLAQDK